ncbi:MAG: hypothetical protein K8S99_13080 [Planctomycetes bacterium]|nr:hypothetical protein [Planctomycetota bacterium]
MRVAQSLLCLICCALIVGCTQRSENAGLLLDNHGGISHSGRWIELRADGSYTDTAYTDVPGDQHSATGRYTFNADRTLLTMTPERGETEHLYRIDYRAQQYWVHDDERERITRPGETWLRQVSLRVVP